MAQNRDAPALQTPSERPISFLLDDAVSGGDQTEIMSLWVRPEDLTRQYPSRLNITQTLGGAWADSFGPGVSTITIAGHTGWRRDQADNDGETRFGLLRERVFDQWHQRRDAAVKSGRDPSGVQLVFSDALDNFAAVVAPLQFVLRRSRSRPLLHQYQIQLAVLSDDASVSFPFLEYIPPEIQQKLGVESLAASNDKITGLIPSIKNAIDSNLVGPVQAFMQKTREIYNKVYSAIKSVDGIASSLINVAQMSAQAGANIFRTLAAIGDIPAHAKGLLMDISTAYTNIFCVMRNALKTRQVYEDYVDLYGSSNCSSTSGGRPLSPLAGVNAFSVTNPAPKPPIVGVTPDAQASLKTLAGSDVVLAPLPKSVLGQSAATIAGGVVLA